MATARNKVKSKAETVNDEAAEIAAIEAALNGEGDADLELNDEDFSDVDEEALSAAITADELKESAYKDQKGSSDIATSEEVDAAAAASALENVAEADPDAPAKQPRAKAAGGAARDAELFAKTISGILGEDATLDSEEGALSEDQLQTAMMAVTQIKVREKVINLCNHVMNGTKLNGYTKIAADLLVSAQLDGCKPLTKSEIDTAYRDAGYKPGTVSAQSGQLMVLFRQMGMAKLSARGILEPNPNSVILDALASS